jgi:hypothetical protein
MSAFLSVALEQCIPLGHRFKTAWSDKTPLKVSLICVTCTEGNPGKTAYVAYGTDYGSFGAWRQRRTAKEIEWPNQDDV